MSNSAMATCATCVSLGTCIIFQTARESQIVNIQPNMFGCMWHMTPEEYRHGLPLEPDMEAQGG